MRAQKTKQFVNKEVVPTLPVPDAMLADYDFLLKNRVIKGHAGPTDAAALKLKLVDDRKTVAKVSSSVAVANNMTAEDE